MFILNPRMTLGSLSKHSPYHSDGQNLIELLFGKYNHAYFNQLSPSLRLTSCQDSIPRQDLLKHRLGSFSSDRIDNIT